MPESRGVHNSVIDSCELVTDKLLAQTDLTLDDIVVFITCDQTTMTWEAQLQRIKIHQKFSIIIDVLTIDNLHILALLFGVG